MLIFHFVMSVLLHIQIIHIIRPVCSIKKGRGEHEHIFFVRVSSDVFFQFAAEVMREEGRGQ